MYIKLVISGDLGSGVFECALTEIDIYDTTNTKLTLSSTNVIQSTYTINNTATYINNLFNGIFTKKTTPYYDNYYNSGNSVTMIINLNGIAAINKIVLESYCYAEGAKYVDIYYSLDNITYIYSGKVTFTTTLQVINYIQTMPVSIIKYLIKQSNSYYSIKPAYYDINTHIFIPLTLSSGLVPNKADIELFGFDDASSLTTLTTIGTETFRPVDKLLSNFQIKKYKSK